MKFAAFAFALAASAAAASPDALTAALAEKVLPDGMERNSAVTIFNALSVADLAADDAWLAVKTRAEYDSRRMAMREKMIAAVGGLPERTPLNARTVGTVVRDGYRVEKVLFESTPGAFVAANLFLPTNPKFSAPFPAVVVTCGHSDNGKASSVYQRGCVQAAKCGIAAFIYDPIDQGERNQSPDGKLRICNGHNAIGARAAMLGWSTARFRIWDGVRSIDYVASRPEIDSSRIGYMGQSGGGTMTSLMMSVDPRIKAACPSCYLTNLRALCAHMGPQDAEQNIYGQLAFGLNHAGYVLLQNVPVSVTCTFDDMFSYYGTRETWRTAAATLAEVGDAEKIAIADAPGPHGWRESTREASVRWMRRWLKDDRSAAPFDMAALRRLDLSFDPKLVDMGLTEAESRVTPDGDVRKLPGFRSSYEILRGEFAAARKHAPTQPLGASAKTFAGVKPPKETGVVAVECAAPKKSAEGWTATKFAFNYPDGLSLPATFVAPAETKSAPTLIVGDAGRAACAAEVRAALAAGSPALVADLTAWGEIGKPMHRFYGAANDDEGAALMLYLLGESLVGRRASDVVALADFLRSKCAAAPRVVACGRAAIPAAHAFAASRGSFAGIELRDAPGSWREALDGHGRYAFADVVVGALRNYDWPDLLK